MSFTNKGNHDESNAESEITERPPRSRNQPAQYLGRHRHYLAPKGGSWSFWRRLCGVDGLVHGGWHSAPKYLVCRPMGLRRGLEEGARPSGENDWHGSKENASARQKGNLKTSQGSARTGLAKPGATGVQLVVEVMAAKLHKNLFQNWLAIELRDKTLAETIRQLNVACGTAYQSNMPSKFEKAGYSLERIPTCVRQYMMRKVLPEVLDRELSEKELTKLVERLT